MGVAIGAPLVTLEYHLTGTALQVTPTAVAVPKGIAGSVRVNLTGGEGAQALANGGYVEAFLRGPGFPEPRRIVSAVNQPMLFPPLNLVGDYQLSGIRLVDAVTGETRMEATPNIVPVRVFDEVLVSRVTSRPLTAKEIEEKGIFIDESNFRVVEFEAAFVLDGKTIPITFPVVAPKFRESTEIIPAAELEERLKEAAVLNQQIAGEVVQLPPEFETAQLNIEVQGINFQVVDPEEEPGLSLRIPPIPALMVIPGNIGYLNQFFSVQIFTENAAPPDSGLSVRNVRAQLKLPPGPDRVPATEYARPGDDPLRFARVGPDKVIQPVQSIVKPGPDGQVGTADDVGHLQAGESAQAEFLVEGLQEGLHVMDLDLSADLDGLAAGTVQVMGKAAGSVLVRNPRFSLAFSHPRTVRAGEPYTASVTILNTGITPANFVQISLNKNSISGARLEDETQQTVQLGTLLPGQSATATFKMRSLRTGAVSFSNLTTSDDSVVGRFRLSMGVDERGVPLSPDTLAMPDFVNNLPENVVFAATRVLGQALSGATAGQVPAGVLRVGKSTITRRVLELAEAGQRLRYGDPLRRVLPDLLRDWQGGRQESGGFDQLLRETDAGREWREAIFDAMSAADRLSATDRLAERAADLAGLGQDFAVASAPSGDLRIDFGDGKLGAVATNSSQSYALVYRGTNGAWAITAPHTNATISWQFTNGPPSADIGVLLVGTNGQARQLRWHVASPAPTAVFRVRLSRLNTLNGLNELNVDLDGNGTDDSTIQPFNDSTIPELPPTLLAVEQDLTVNAGRPGNPCVGPSYLNYGTIVAVVFSKPVSQATAGMAESYTLDGDNGANSVQVQPGGRVAYLNLRKGISAIRPRTLMLTNVADLRGNAIVNRAMAVRSLTPGTTAPFTGGVAIRGRALKGNGRPAVGIPVTLTMYDRIATGQSCDPWIRRVSQVLTDAGGNFDFDFVMAGIRYSISATDTSGLGEEAIDLIAQATSSGEVDRQRLEQFADSPAARDTLLGLLAAGSLPEAIVKVEGLDRALVNDLVGIGSSREGQEVPIALRFRGRATVVGRVVAENGTTPIPRAAVNLFPDADSRELGRGVFADDDGRFAFNGVPLGVFTIEVKTSDRRARTVAGLLDTPGQITNLIVALPSTITPLTSLRGRVFEADNITPHAGARVFLGTFDGDTVRNVVRIVDADNEGNWRANDVPLRALDVVAVSFDGQRKGVRTRIDLVPNSVSVVNVTLEATTLVFGRVQFEDGRPATNALVAGGRSLVRTDPSGNFALEGVPVGHRQFSAGLERNPTAGIDFPRLGSESIQVVAGANNFVVIKLRASGRIFGRVVDANGRVQGGIRVAIPIEGGFFWTDADSQGNYSFEGLGLGSYTLSAPANAVFDNNLDVARLNQQIRSGKEDEILAAFEEAVRVFIGADDPLVTGAQLNFRPSSWGFTRAALRFDGESVQANIRFIVQGTVTGRVINHQGVPIGARVRLTGLGPARNGEPKITIRGERDSDPATGLFVFPGQLLAGPWTLQVASPFYPSVLSESGFTTEIDPNATNIVLQFPPIREVNGRIAGRVLNPDGSLVGGGVRVKINISDDYEIRTETNGTFDTQIALPGGRYYRGEAFDTSSGLKGENYVWVTPGITNFLEVKLLTRQSAIHVTVRRGNGQPASGAQVDLEHGSFPRENRVTLFANATGEVTFDGLWEGNYAVCAQYAEGATRVFARGGAKVGPNQTNDVALRLGATASIAGRFVKRDQATPVEAAQVAVGNLGFATTDAEGRFRFDGVPLGTYRLVTSDPVSGAAAQASVTVSIADQVQDVLIVESARGEVNGFVLESYGNGFVAGATVRINYTDGLTPGRTVTTGPDGRFSFPGSPVGRFTLSASDLPRNQGGRGVSGSASGTLSEPALVTAVEIQLQRLGVLPVRVVREDGVTPADNAAVTLAGNPPVQKDTDARGEVAFVDLPVNSTHSITAVSRRGGELRNGASARATIFQVGTNATLVVRLPGVGRVNGRVVGSDGSTTVPGAEVVITYLAGVFAGQTRIAVTAADGAFSYDDVPVGAYRITAASVSLAGSVNGEISAANEIDAVTLRLGDSGRVTGRLVRADGVTPVSGIDVALTYDSQSVNPGRAAARSAADGTFAFENIPIGAFHLASAAPAFGGVIERDSAITANGQTVALGTLTFDEAFPTVVSVTPRDTAIGVPITTTVELLFSEALHTNSINPAGIFVRSPTGTVASAVRLLGDSNGVARLVRLTPLRPLVSEQTYQVVVIAGEFFGGGGIGVGAGPRDLVGRPLAAPFTARFTTADNDPPVLLSIFPSNNAAQIDPRAVPRLSFNESLRTTGFVFRVTGPEGVVPGQVGVGVNGQVLSFVPATELRANAIYTMSVSNILDLAGNRSTNEPYVTRFATLDTVGPTIATLRIGDGRLPVAGSVVPVEALLATNESAVVRFTQDFAPLGSATNGPFRINVTLPRTGSTTVRAIATDAFGNDGPVAELVIAVRGNQPPTIRFERVTPLDGPIPSGSFVAVDVIANDDSLIAELAAIVAGLGTGELTRTNTGRLRVQGLVSAASGPGQQVEIFAEAKDDTGLSSGQVKLMLPISDATAPTLSVTAPTPQTQLVPGTTVPVTVQLADNFGVAEVTLAVSGAFSNLIQTAISPALTNGSRVVNLPVPANAPTNGELVQLSFTARDAAGNVSVAVAHSLRMLDRVAPLLVSASPTNGATGQSLWLNAVGFDFDQPLDPLTITNNVRVTNNAGVATPFTVRLANGNRRLLVVLRHPLMPGVIYTNLLLPGLADGSSNLWRNAGGATVSPAGAAFTFTTARILSVAPTNGSRFLAGQNVPVSVAFEPGLGAGFFRFRMNSNAPVQVSVPANATNVTAQIPMPSNGPAAVLAISASDTASFDEPLALAPITVSLAPTNPDTDGDGMPDTWEIAYHLDPFVNDANLDPDTDALTNAQEFLAGTDPHNPDTDGDGRPDGSDPDPLNSSFGLRPTELTFDVVGIANAQNANQDYGDRVTNRVMGNFTYGGADPFTPNVTVSYGASDPAFWTRGYGSLTNVLFEDDDGNGVLTIVLTADTGFEVNLHRFDLAAYTTAFASDPMVSAVQVFDQDGIVVFSSTNQVVSRTAFTPLEFTPALSDRVLTIRVDARNLGNLNDDIAVDNLRFSQGLSSNRPPAIQFTNVIEIVQGVATNFAVNASDPDGNLRRLLVRESLQDEDVRLFDVLQFTPSGSNEVSNSGSVSNLTATLTLLHSFTNTVEFVLRAVDSDGLSATHVVSVVTLPDLDRDGVPDRDDPDIDGDGVANAQEIALGTDSRKPDTDGDGLVDSEEIAAGADGLITDPLKADTDNDGVSDAFEIALGLNPTNGTDTAGTVIISNRTVTVGYGIHRIGTLILTNGAVLTHSAPALAPGLLGEPKLELVVGDLVVDATSRIDVSARGYLGGRSEANSGNQAGRTLGNVLGSTRRNGGSYGGLGSIGNTEQTLNYVYGAFDNPNELGSGGGSDAGTGGNGGGLVRITAKSLTLEGQILANGGNGGFTGGGGSGGGIRISADTLSGAGRIQANGGAGDGNSGDGGGGRIAIYWTNVTSFSFTNVQALGGSGGLREGTPGTLFIHGQSNDLMVDAGKTNNMASATPLISLAGGSSTALDAHTLTDRRAAFIPGSLIGLRLKPNTNSPASFRIVGNGQSRIFTDPADGSMTSVASVGNSYGASHALGLVAIRNGATVELLDGDQARTDRRSILTAVDLELSNQARLTHPVANTSSQFALELLIADAVAVDSTSLIDVSARGYLGGRSGANVDNQSGRTLGNVFGSTRRNGGSYGGLGAVGNTESTVNGTYGSYSDPNEVGSGGGSDAGNGGNGGGLVRITANRLALEGQILANGGTGGFTGGGGSGGGIKIVTDTISGSGVIRANGGGGDSNSGGGGGGRVAIYYNSAGFDFSNVTVIGGQAATTGGVGTALIQQANATPRIIVRNSGRETPLPSLNGEHLVLDGAIASATNLIVSSLTLTNGAVLTHPGAGTDHASELHITVNGPLFVSTNSRIDVSARGYLGGRAGANSGQAGRTLGNTLGSTRRNGGSYGGLGAFGNTEQTVNEQYGSYSDPSELGSGGGSDAGNGGNGGGLVWITADRLTLEGEILANGGNGGFTGGGGSGGGIKITTGTLTGEGTVQANGGGGDGNSGGGGGGRIAVYYVNATGFAFTNLQALGGSALNTGGPGTIYMKQGTSPALLVVRSNGRETPLPVTQPTEHLLLDNTTVSATNLTLANLVLTNGAVLTHPGAGVSNENRLEMIVGTLFISTNSRIDVSTRGYLGGRTAANSGNQAGRTLGNMLGSTRRNGGSYGGLGALGNTEQTVNEQYGSYADPNEVGSGGGSDAGNGGTGGGLVWITANAVMLEGQILANGANGGFTGGGGSGGGIKITAGTLAGEGVVQANGGGGDGNSGGGGGGRIAVYYVNATGFAFTNLQALGGPALNTGGPGTIYIKQGNSAAQLIVRSNGRETPLPLTQPTEHLLLDNTTVSATNLTLANLALTNGAVLTHPGTGVSNENRLEMIVGTLFVSTNSRIDVSTRGYLGGRVGANSDNQAGRTLGNILGSTRRNGGGYGGAGAFGNVGGTINPLYGTAENPDSGGSGGGSDAGTGGTGGGLVRITANILALQGQVLANGANGGFTGGGGSGGGIRISVRTLSGEGAIRAGGGDGDGNSGGGGGGRIAIYYETAPTFPLANVAANGGAGLNFGQPGSVVFQQTNFISGGLFSAGSGTTDGPSLSIERSSLLQLRLRLGNTATSRVVVQTSTNLVDWTDLSTNSTGRTLELHLNAPVRFYRTLVP